jgi:hypothetical protein
VPVLLPQALQSSAEHEVPDVGGVAAQGTTETNAKHAKSTEDENVQIPSTYLPPAQERLL